MIKKGISLAAMLTIEVQIGTSQVMRLDKRRGPDRDLCCIVQEWCKQNRDNIIDQECVDARASLLFRATEFEKYGFLLMAVCCPTLGSSVPRNSRERQLEQLHAPGRPINV